MFSSPFSAYSNSDHNAITTVLPTIYILSTYHASMRELNIAHEYPCVNAKEKNNN